MNYIVEILIAYRYLLEDSNLELLLKALTIFISAPAGARFLDEFIEVGGLVTTLEIVNLSIAKDVCAFRLGGASSHSIG